MTTCGVSVLNGSTGYCRNKATQQFEYAPYGTAGHERFWENACTRHYNAIVLGKGNYDGYTYIVTSPKAQEG